MNQQWSEQNKNMQKLLQKATFSDGIAELISLRGSLMEEMLSWKGALNRTDFDAMPFLNAEGYHSKNIAYSIWHIFRIEDIVVNTLIRSREEVLFSGGYLAKTNSPIITTGNELGKEEISSFSRELNLDGLYQYVCAVKEDTDEWLRGLEYADLKQKFTDADRERIKALSVVSEAESAAWLIDYWCGKDVKGLLKMPLSRHWIMHIEAAIRIMRKLKKS